jgi:hypothetical protein
LGPALESVARKKYYVIFIDDYNKITWIYLIKFKSEVSTKFKEFQTLVEHLFNMKIIVMQTDLGGGGGGIPKVNFFSLKYPSHIVEVDISCPSIEWSGRKET